MLKIFLRPLLLSLLALLACANKPPARGAPPCAHPPRLQLITVAAPQLNLSQDGEPWPLHLRIYQLAAAPRRALELAEVRADDAAFGARVISRDDRVIYPGDRSTWLIDQDPAATHIAALALFRQPAAAGWFRALPLPGPSACSPAPACLRLTLDHNLLSAAPLPPVDDPSAPLCAPWTLPAPPSPPSPTSASTKAPPPRPPAPPSPPSTAPPELPAPPR